MEPQPVQFDERLDRLVDLSLQWVIGQIVEDTMTSLSGLGENASGERVTFSLTGEDDDATFALAQKEVAESNVQVFALLGVGILQLEDGEVSVFVLYTQAPEDTSVRRFLCAFQFQEEEDGETSIALSEWEEVEPMGVSWLSA